MEDAVVSREHICSLCNVRRTAVTSSVHIICLLEATCLDSTVCMARCGLRAEFMWLCKSETIEDHVLYNVTVVSRCTSKAMSLPAAILRDALWVTASSKTYRRLCIHSTYSPIEYNVQTRRFLGFGNICATYTTVAGLTRGSVLGWFKVCFDGEMKTH